MEACFENHKPFATKTKARYDKTLWLLSKLLICSESRRTHFLQAS